MQLGLFVVIPGYWQVQTGFYQLLISILIKRWLHLSKSLWEIHLHCDLFRKRTDQKKFPFIETKNWIVLAAHWSVNIFLLQIPQYSEKVVVKRRRREAISKRYAFQSNAKSKHNLKFVIKIIHYCYVHTVKIFGNLILKNHWTWTWKILDYLTGFWLTLWYTGLELKK